MHGARGKPDDKLSEVEPPHSTGGDPSRKQRRVYMKCECHAHMARKKMFQGSGSPSCSASNASKISRMSGEGFCAEQDTLIA